jgi:probable HAF family extracellular repeat protein
MGSAARRVRGRWATPLAVAFAVVVALACVAGMLRIHPASAQTASAEYSITDLGTLPGGTGSFAFDINNRGQVVGTSDTASGESRAVLWEDGDIANLGTLGGNDSVAWGVNNRGQVVGESTTASDRFHAFFWEDGEMVDLGTLAHGGRFNFSRANSINDRGQIVGRSTTASGTDSHAVLWTKRGLHQRLR